MITFSHSGHIGDILYSLHFCKEYMLSMGQEKCIFHIRTNVFDQNVRNHPNGSIRITLDTVQYLRPLLQQVEFIQKVTCGDEIPQGAVNLDLFRQRLLNTVSNDLRGVYYSTLWESNQIPKADFSEKLFQTRSTIPHLHDKVLVCVSQRYSNPFVDFSSLDVIKGKLLFCGLTRELKSFEEKSGLHNLQYFPVKDMLQLAVLMNSVRLVIGNLTGNYALAEIMKVPRILVPQDFQVYMKGDSPGITFGVANIEPIMNGMCVHSQDQLKRMIKHLFNIKDDGKTDQVEN